MNKNRIITLADTIEAVRPDWTHTGIVNHLTTLNTNWAGSDAELAAHALTIAANPAAQTPGALNARMPPTARKPPKPRDELEPNCYTCGQTKSQCERQQDFEIAHGIPDPHPFETEQNADRNARPITPERKQAIMAKIGGLLKNVNDELAKPQLVKLLAILISAYYLAPLRNTK